MVHTIRDATESAEVGLGCRKRWSVVGDGAGRVFHVQETGGGVIPEIVKNFPEFDPFDR